MNTSYDELQKATQRARAALDSRAAVLDLDKNLVTRAQTAAREEIDATTAWTDADISAVLGQPTDSAVWTEKAVAEAAKAAKAKQKQERLKALRERVPMLLQSAEDEITAAFSEYTSAIDAYFDTVRSDVAAQVRPVAAQLAQILQRGHALAAAGVGLGTLLIETKVINPAKDNFHAFISGTRTILDDEPVSLDNLWRDDPHSVALFEKYKPFHELKTEFRREANRIDDRRRRTMQAANRNARMNPPGSEAARPPGLAMLNASMAARLAAATARDATPHVATAPLNIGMDRKEPLTPAEMDTLWLQASGGIPRPAPDAIFIDIAGRIPPWQVQNLIEREARAEAMKARRDSDLNTSSQKFQPPSVVRDVTIPVDTGDDDIGPPLSRAQIDALWLPASGGIPRPAPDAVFTDIAGRIPPRQVQSPVEREARMVAAKARRDSDLKEYRQRIQPAPLVVRDGTITAPSIVRDGTIPVDIGDDDVGPPLSQAQMDALEKRA